MDLVSFSLFVDFLLLAGAARFTAARASLREPFDCYSAFKDAAKAVAAGTHPKALEQLLGSFGPDDKRGRLYPPLVKGFTRWLSKNQGMYFAPAATHMPIAAGVAVAVNPEIAGVLDGVPVVIKFYCRTEKLTAERSTMMIAVMQGAIHHLPNTVFAVLDVREGKLHVSRSTANLARASFVARAEGPAYATLRALATSEAA